MEIWKSVVAWEDAYEVSSLGRVRSLDRVIVKIDPRSGKIFNFNLKGRLLRQTPNEYGYFSVMLSDVGHPDRGKARRKTHQLVAEAFIGPRPLGLETCHCNGIKTDNRVENLRYDTKFANEQDKYIHNTVLRGSKNAQSKLKEQEVLDICLLRKQRKSLFEIATAYNVSPSLIGEICRGEKWSHLTGIVYGEVKRFRVEKSRC